MISFSFPSGKAFFPWTRRQFLAGSATVLGKLAGIDPIRPVKGSDQPQPGDIFTNRLGMRFRWIPQGDFVMGSPEDEPERELPKEEAGKETQHSVTLSHGFFMAINPVTRSQFTRFVAKTEYQTQAETDGGTYALDNGQWKLNPKVNWRNPGFEQTDDHPVVCLSWNDCSAFVKWLAREEKTPYRLPTEAEWEYACRAGTKTPFSTGSTISTDQANYNGSFVYGNGKKGINRQKTVPVGSFPANPFGLYDMHGNVFQWCNDWASDYPRGKITDPRGPEKGEEKILRGGSWFHQPRNCRSAYRGSEEPSKRYNKFGMRLCYTPAI